MTAHEEAYYRNRNRIIAFHRLIRIVISVAFCRVQGRTPGVPPSILGGASSSGAGGGVDGGGMYVLVRALILRCGLPFPWITVLNFPAPFPMQARKAPRPPPNTRVRKRDRANASAAHRLSNPFTSHRPQAAQAGPCRGPPCL